MAEGKVQKPFDGGLVFRSLRNDIHIGVPATWCSVLPSRSAQWDFLVTEGATQAMA
jgi:hypothetical protein